MPYWHLVKLFFSRQLCLVHNPCLFFTDRDILGDKPETTTPWLAEKILANEKGGVCIAWLSPMKIMKHFMMAPFNKCDPFADLEKNL